MPVRGSFKARKTLLGICKMVYHSARRARASPRKQVQAGRGGQQGKASNKGVFPGLPQPQSGSRTGALVSWCQGNPARPTPREQKELIPQRSSESNQGKII